MRAFLNQPVEAHTGVIECMIRRKKGVMNTVYQAFYEVIAPIVRLRSIISLSENLMLCDEKTPGELTNEHEL